MGIMHGMSFLGMDVQVIRYKTKDREGLGGSLVHCLFLQTRRVFDWMEM